MIVKFAQRAQKRHFQPYECYYEKRNFRPRYVRIREIERPNFKNESFEGVSHFNFRESGEGPRATRGNYSSLRFIQYTRIKHGTHTSGSR